VGEDYSTLPFVYGRVYRNPEYAPNSEAGLAGVIGGQDAFAADTSNVNVSMLDTRSDLIDLYTREHVDLVQQDGWHYDSYTQQLMGEAFVRKVNAMQPVYSDTKSVNVLSNEQALYTATLNYITGVTAKVKLGSNEIEEGAEHLKEIKRLVSEYNKSESQCPLRLPDLLMVITGGEYAYTREDGVVVCPVSALKP
jgi:hypothetical protein